MTYDEDKGSIVNGSTSIFYFYWIAPKVTFSAEIQEASSLEYPSHNNIKYSRFPCINLVVGVQGIINFNPNYFVSPS